MHQGLRQKINYKSVASHIRSAFCYNQYRMAGAIVMTAPTRVGGMRVSAPRKASKVR